MVEFFYQVEEAARDHYSTRESIMAQFTLQFSMTNADFAVTDFASENVASILKNVAESVEYGAESGVIHDSNGNSIGSWNADYDSNV